MFLCFLTALLSRHRGSGRCSCKIEWRDQDRPTERRAEGGSASELLAACGHQIRLDWREPESTFGRKKSAQASKPPMIALTSCGVIGICVIRPLPPSASSTAEAITAPTAATPPSPAPLMPSGLQVLGA